MMLYHRLRYWEHIQMVCDKAMRVVRSLIRLIGIKGSLKTNKRQVLSTVNALLLYDAEV